MARVTVRTLHHYDEIGLLVPSARTDAGYRLYTTGDLERLHQILLYRELGFPLAAIRRVIDRPVLERVDALRAQRELLVERRRRTDAIIRAVDRTLEAWEMGETMDIDSLSESFEALADAPAAVREHHARYRDEARERWGETEAYAESMRRAKECSREDWERIQAEGDENEARMAALMAAGADPEGDEATAVAEAMRQHISRWFYPCSHEMHASLADMYEADERFRAHYDARATGLASFVARAIRANARKAGAQLTRDRP